MPALRLDFSQHHNQLEKTLKNLLMNFVLCLSLFVLGSSMAVACEITGSGLPSEMKQKLIVECEQMKLAAQSAPEAPKVTKEDLSEWANISQEFAKAIGIAAKEMGVAVNEFITTPAGILTAGVILWHTLGADAIKILSILGVTLVIYVLNRALWFSHYESYRRSIGVFSWEARVRRNLKWEKMEDTASVMSILSVVLLIGYIAVILGTL